MIRLLHYRLNFEECGQQLDEFKQFLDKNLEISESSENGLQKFFADRPSLILLIGYWSYGLTPAFYKTELNLFNNEFRADFVISDRLRKKFMFIEFEDAKANSVFKPKSSTKGSANISYEWSPRYEHGLSQIIDWYYRIDDYERTNKMEEYFGSREIDYTGLLVIGRDKFIQEAGLMSRFKWRSKKTIINNKPLHCMTFDQLYEELLEKFYIETSDQLD